jgi:hypothetical protein
VGVWKGGELGVPVLDFLSTSERRGHQQMDCMLASHKRLGSGSCKHFYIYIHCLCLWLCTIDKFTACWINRYTCNGTACENVLPLRLHDESDQTALMKAKLCTLRMSNVVSARGFKCHFTITGSYLCLVLLPS